MRPIFKTTAGRNSSCAAMMIFCKTGRSNGKAGDRYTLWAYIRIGMGRTAKPTAGSAARLDGQLGDVGRGCPAYARSFRVYAIDLLGEPGRSEPRRLNLSSTSRQPGWGIRWTGWV